MSNGVLVIRIHLYSILERSCWASGEKSLSHTGLRLWHGYHLLHPRLQRRNTWIYFTQKWESVNAPQMYRINKEAKWATEMKILDLSVLTHYTFIFICIILFESRFPWVWLLRGERLDCSHSSRSGSSLRLNEQSVCWWSRTSER